MDIKKQFGTNKVKEIEGIWHDFGDGCQVLIARMGNEEYRKAFRRISKPYQKAIRRETLPEDKAQQLLIQSMAEAIVLDWKGLQEDKQDIQYSKENVIRILTKYRDFREEIMDVANEMDNFKLESDEESEKNLLKS